MSIICNGAHSPFSARGKKAFKRTKPIKRSEEESFPLEIGFRGFTKDPRVVLQRLDTSPYLKEMKNKECDSDKVIINKLVNSVHLSKLLQKCSVKIVRQDLENLKNITQNKYNSPFKPNMTEMKCKICKKRYSSEKKLQNHQDNKHMIEYKPENKPQKRVSFSDHVIVHEVKEYHRCRKCPKIFEDYKLLKQHMKQKHKKRKCYICNYCSKKFVDRMFFKVHIRLHCDVCGLLLPNKSTFNNHRRNVCKVFKLHKCKVCEDTFYRFMDLKDHGYDHLGTFFICDICKDQFDTKCAVSHHIAFLHSKRRPTSLFTMHNLGNDRLYSCNFCEESSVEREVVENHVQVLPDLTNRAMTGYKDYYFCDQCLKKFATETDMLQHKWSHFLKTSEDKAAREKIESNKKTAKKKLTYKMGEEIPKYLQPVVVLEKLNIPENKNLEINNDQDEPLLIDTSVEDMVITPDLSSMELDNYELCGPLVDPKSKKTLLSKHQCEMCGKYYSSGYCLSRHKQTQHLLATETQKHPAELLHNNVIDNDLRCNMCEESFVWPSLLQRHKCIRFPIPEMPFNDARPEIHFDNNANEGFDDFNISEDQNYMNSVDFEIPAPIVEMVEYPNFVPSAAPNEHVNNNGCMPQMLVGPLQNLGYKLVMQEVPIEF